VQVVFRDARDAVRWCVAVQMQLLKLEWPEAPAAKCPEEAGTVRAPPGGAARPVPSAAADLADDMQARCNVFCHLYAVMPPTSTMLRPALPTWLRSHCV
jgi:hypothetical protein